MKKIIAIFLSTVICLSLAACGKEDNPTISEPDDSIPISSNESSNLTESNSSDTASDPSSTTSSNNSSTPFTPEKLDPNFDLNDETERYKVDFDSWQMYLANPWNPVPESCHKFTASSPEIAKIDQKYRPNPAESSQIYFDARAIQYLNAMIEAAAADGINLDVISAYRTHAYQTGNFQRQVDRVKAANPGMSEEDAIAEAATVVAKPGTSEHQLGLAVDLNSLDQSFCNTKAYAWLIENCTDYGFILRYTAEKQSKTGIVFEPWHYRFVGVKNAKMIEASGLCMEEFIEKYNQNQ